MRTTITSSYDEDEYKSSYNVSIETEEYKGEADFNEGEPEDATLGRDFSDVYKIPELLKEAYKAGLRGESFEMGEV